MCYISDSSSNYYKASLKRINLYKKINLLHDVKAGLMSTSCELQTGEEEYFIFVLWIELDALNKDLLRFVVPFLS